MTVYVDELPPSGWGRWNGGAHMLGTDLDELHAMARELGLRRSWFQGDSTFAHYDLTRGKRAKALVLGAVSIEAGEIPDDVLMQCSDGEYRQRHELRKPASSTEDILSLDVEAPLHRLPFWLKNAAEVSWPVHDPPAVWNRWPGIAGLPLPQRLPGIPENIAVACDMPDAPTLHVIQAEGEET